MKLNIAAYYPKGTNGVSEILPLLLSSGSLSVPLVSSVDVNEKKEKLWISGGTEETWAATIRYRKSVCCFIISSYTYCSCIWVYPQRQVVSAAISAEFDRHVDVGHVMWLLSMWLHYLAPRCPGSSLSFSLACHQRWYRSCWCTGQEEENTNRFWASVVSIVRESWTTTAKWEVFVPLMLLHSCINVPEEQRLWFNCKG